MVTIRLSLLLLLLACISHLRSDDLPCSPNNWKHTWTTVGNVWYTALLKEPGDWKTVEEQCKGIEPHKTNLASIRNVQEKNHITSADFPDGEYWVGGVRLAESLWFWYKDDGKGAKTLTDISPTFWAPKRPYRDEGGTDELCLALFNFKGNGTWRNANCEEKKTALCEIRC